MLLHYRGYPLNNTEKVKIIWHSPIFASLSDAELTGLATITTERLFNPGEIIFFEGDAPDWFYIVAEGRVKAFKQSSVGKEFTIAYFSPGEIFGEVAVFENKPYPASASSQSAGETVVLGIKREELLTFLAKHPAVALRIIGVLGERLRNAQSRLGDMAGEKALARLAGILLMLTSKMGSELPFTRQEIADMTGTTIETTIRILSRLKGGGIIRSTRGKIIILDEAKLKALSAGPPEF
jgi:CRP/FNR family transcriptional regulator